MRESFASKLRRAATYIVILAVAIYLYEVAEHFQYEHEPGRIGPDAWPKIVLALLIATCAWQVGRVLIFGAPTAQSDEGDEEAPSVPTPTGNYVRFAWMGIALTVVYAWLMPLLGFFVSTALFIAGIASVAGRYRSLLPLAATSLVAPVCLMFVFMRIVYISLPLGHGIFKDLSLVLLKVLGVR